MIVPDDLMPLATGVAVALGAGLLIGLERERRKRRRGPPGARGAAGIRTFAMAALAGALAQGLAQPWLVALGALAVVLLVALAYHFGRAAALGHGSDDPGLTTELALVVTYLLGVLAIPQPALAAAIAVLVAALLAARARLHRFATRLLTEAEMHDALLLAALALVLFPLVPAAPMAALGGIEPRSLMWLLLLILLLQGTGHVALRWLGASAGLALSGFLAGFVSSTAAIASLGPGAREQPQELPMRAAGAVLSAVATWVLALAMLLALAPAAARALAPAAAAGAVLTIAAAGWCWRRARAGAVAGHTAAAAPSAAATATASPSAAAARGPLRLREAALVALLLSLAALGVGWAQRTFGEAGLLAGTALAAVADAHASVAALAALHAAGQLDAAAVRDGALVAIGVNSLSRSAVAFAAGGRRFGAIVAGTLLAAMLAATAVAFGLARLG